MDAAHRVRLSWGGGERFSGTVGGVPITLDGNADDEIGPMQALAAAVAGCMGIDVAMILEKGRQPLVGLEIELTGDRAEQPPRRFVALRMHFRITGDVAPARVERALELSRTTYCSVWQSLRQEIDLQTTFEVASAE